MRGCFLKEAMENFKEELRVVDAQQLQQTLYQLTHQVLERHPDVEDLVLLGIRTRGVYLAKRVQRIIKELKHKEVPLGILDITLYRDDLTTIGPKPVVKSTRIDFDLNGCSVLLVDDVLFTGRTIRSALAEIVDFGRPKKVELLVLIDRGHRELPIQADYVGKTITTTPEEMVKVYLKEVDGKDEVVVIEKADEEE